MFASLVDFLERSLGDRSTGVAEDADAAARLAVATLCVEMARADFDEHPNELQQTHSLLTQRFRLNKQEADNLLQAARAQSDQAVSLYRFTRPLNQHFDMQGKIGLIEMLWQVALEDGNLDKYEDALMHKLADLLYVPLADLMLAKQRVLDGK